MDGHPNLTGPVSQYSQTQLTRHKLPQPIPLKSQPESRRGNFLRPTRATQTKEIIAKCQYALTNEDQ